VLSRPRRIRAVAASAFHRPFSRIIITADVVFTSSTVALATKMPVRFDAGQAAEGEERAAV